LYFLLTPSWKLEPDGTVTKNCLAICLSGLIILPVGAIFDGIASVQLIGDVEVVNVSLRTESNPATPPVPVKSIVTGVYTLLKPTGKNEEEAPVATLRRSSPSIYPLPVLVIAPITVAKR